MRLRDRLKVLAGMRAFAAALRWIVAARAGRRSMTDVERGAVRFMCLRVLVELAAQL